MKRRLSLALVPLLFPVIGFGLTVEEAVKHVNSTNPVIIERIKNYEATTNDIRMAESGYYPSIDLEAKYGNEYTDNLAHDRDTNDDVSLKRYERAIKASINLFEGFGTVSGVEKEKARTEAAKNSIMEKANSLGLQTVEAYLELMKQRDFLTIAEENLKTHEAIHARINERTESGFGSKSEQDQSQARLALAKSNLTIQQSNFRDALAKFTRLYGEEVSPESLVKPVFGYALPVTFDSAVQQAEQQHPAIAVQTANIHAAEQNAKNAEKAYYPRLDAELTRYQNDNIDGTRWHDNSRSAMLILSYNLFGGYYYEANRDKQRITVLQERAILSDLKRGAKENVTYAWIAYEELANQIPHLKAHRDYSVTTLEAYNQEFSLGRRTLIDLLNAENERTSADKELINAEYDLLLAKYRILEATGTLIASLNAERPAE